jgi:PAS domain S-box-containing protein
VEQIDDAVIVVDEDFRMLVLNAAARGLFGLPEENVIGRPIMDFNQPRRLDSNGGRTDRARVTLIEGGSRFVTLRRVF